MTAHRATTLGAGAVVLWSMLALLTVGSAPVPPLQLNAMCFAIGGTLGLIWMAAAGTLGRLRALTLPALGLGVVGLAGYHLLYFTALRLAPPAEAGLIAYLWPLLIVLFSGLLPGETLRRGHLVGALLGLSGAALLIGAGFSGGAGAALGYILALACALTWAGYSVLSRLMADMPTEVVVIYCLVTAALSGLAHVLLETTVLPKDTLTWLSVIGLGLGPVGLAFFVWDIGVKRGDIQLLGVLSYAAPVLSTGILVVAGLSEPTWRLALATLLITGGALLAARASQIETS
ncbi:MAG: DMT family transporter [Pseudomonadota bacterium]